MSNAELHHWPLTIAHPNLGPGWAPMWQRPGTDDAAIADEIVIHDVYALRGVSLEMREIHPGNPESMTQQVVVDIGANIGFFTMTCVRMGASVIAVEPDHDNFATLRMNVGTSRHVQMVWAAVGAQRGFVGVEGSNGTARTVDNGGAVEMMTLADILSPLPRVSILKVDTEGSEHDILTACPHELLARCDRIVAELHGPPGSPWADPTDWGRIVQHLLETHNCSVFGKPSEGGGHLFANSYSAS